MQAAAVMAVGRRGVTAHALPTGRPFIASPLPASPQIEPLMLLDARRCSGMTSRYPCPKVALAAALAPLLRSTPGSGTEAAGRERDGWICSEEPSQRRQFSAASSSEFAIMLPEGANNACCQPQRNAIPCLVQFMASVRQHACRLPLSPPTAATRLPSVASAGPRLDAAVRPSKRRGAARSCPRVVSPVSCPSSRCLVAWKGLKVRDDQAGLSGGLATALSFTPDTGPYTAN